MSNKILGAIAMACAPFLFVDFLVHGMGEEFEHTSLSGLFSLVFMIGWMCGVVVLLRVFATGTGRFGRGVLYVQLFTLGLANVWNVWEVVSPGASSPVYFVLDFFWPLSQVVLLVIGVTVAVKGQSGPGRGVARFVPLMAGLWFPVTIVLMVVFGQTYPVMVISGAYSVVMWGLMGWVYYGLPGGEFSVRRWMSVGAVL
jgi:hypothetical protein